MFEVTFRYHLRREAEQYGDVVIVAETIEDAQRQFVDREPDAFSRCPICQDTYWYVRDWQEV